VLFDLIRRLREQVDPTRLVYINFEDDRLFPMHLADLEELLQGYYSLFPGNKDQKVWFFLDEVQEVEHWEKFVRRLVDQENCRVYITGSSSRLLSRELATSLRGRTLPYEVFPLSFSEFLRFNQIEASPHSSRGQAKLVHSLNHYLDQGGFPELVFLPDSLHRRTINEYIDLMLYRDLSERFGLRNPALLKYLLKFMLTNLANPISLTKVYNDLKSQGYRVGKNTVFEYMSHLEEAFALFAVEIWSRSVRKKAANPRKVYTIDSAFKHAMSVGADRGRIMENAVFLHLRRQGIFPSYWLDGQEVDFYWETGRLINVCLDLSAPSTRQRELQGLRKAMQQLDLSHSYLVTASQEEEINLDGRRIHVLPVWSFLLEESLS
jgi:hypothetical protein